ncbi:FMN-binding split barrel [Glarea lozoyensis ATCC 20868]|uniref:FMN-binding split barrel n=1 Tax=Glarea lozoyensis (strain ATCC 20868 / MF5171) TaxID=1116229 RepID=S3CIY3_GLAL2|nr:FMN-binding split barrel [Glarea lozoyensis ATCC 20868]EPE25194.1 FMN-binding split barrel [Glarea lozoyensis ATCC 20868]
MASEAPLNYEASSGATNLQITSTLPDEVAQCLQNARFLHLATCTDLYPHVSLMNYTYLPTSPHSTSPTIIMTTNPSSKKTNNLITNPHVSILVHDWVSHRPPTNRRGSTAERTGSPPPEASRSSLAALLLNLNTSAISSISATINGEARLVERGTEEERYYKEQHLENNTFDGGEENGGGWDRREDCDGGRESFIEGEDVRVVVVKITNGRVSDWKGAVRDWSLEGQEAEGERLVNGVS